MNITKIGIVCAMEEELVHILNYLNVKHVKQKQHSFEFYLTSYNNLEIISIICGIGKVNAAVATQKLIDSYAPDCIINFGVAGILSPELTVGDIVIATDTVQYDMDTRAIGDPLGQIPRMPVSYFAAAEFLINLSQNIPACQYKIVQGRIATGDQFISDSTKADFIYATFNALACDMESAAIGQACYLNSIPFMVIRILSDKPGNNGDAAVTSYVKFKEILSEEGSKMIIHILKQLLV